MFFNIFTSWSSFSFFKFWLEVLNLSIIIVYCAIYSRSTEESEPKRNSSDVSEKDTTKHQEPFAPKALWLS